MGIVRRIGAGASAVMLGGSLLLGTREAGAHAGLDVLGPAMADKVSRSPSDPEVRLELAMAHEAGGQWDQALAALDRAAELGADADQVSGLRGRVLVGAGRFDAAIAELDRLIARLPDAPGPRYQRARAFLGTGKPAAAAADFERALATMPRPTPDDVFLWRDALLAAGRQADAVRALDQGMQRVGQVPSLELAALDLEARLGRPDEALARIERLLAQNPTNAAWHARRGELLAQAGRPREAERSYAQALSLIESRPVARRSHRTAALEQRLRAALATRANPGEDTQ